MAIGQMENVLKHLRRILAPRVECGASDGELLERFFVSRDEAAFELLVWRYHRMVLGVCSRILADSNDVEDAFQATFLILSRKGGSIRKRNSLSSWLFGVARRVALEAGRGERLLPPSLVPLPASCPDPCDELIRRELPGIFDEELGLLPEKYRAVIVLCYLEGRTYEEAGQDLGCSKGTVSTRLTRARELLRTRLAGRGLALPAGALAGWMCAHAASAGAPISLISHTIKTVTLVAAGKTAATGLVSVKVAALTEGVVKAMFMTKIKSVLAVLLVLGFVTTGAMLLTHCTAAGLNDKKSSITEEAVDLPAQRTEKVPFTAWGKEFNGLQAGLGYRAGEKGAYAPGETVLLAVRVRNVGKDVVTFRYCKETYFETPPTVTDGAGKPVALTRRRATGFAALLEVKLEPGKEIELDKVELQPRMANQGASDEWNLTTGKFTVWYDQLEDEANDKTLSKLATGKLELEIKGPEKKPQNQTENPTPEAKAKAKALNDQDAIQGTWKVVALEDEGEKDAAKAIKATNIRLAFAGNKLVMSGPTPDLLDVSHRASTFVLNEKTSPKQIDITSVGWTEIGIYAFEKGQLKICLDRTGKNRPTSFMTEKGSDQYCMTLKKQEDVDGFTAWGKEVGGLQAGLSIGNANDIRIGGKATAVILLRNVSNQAITVSVWLDDPRVVDAIGKRVRATTRPAADYEIIPTKLTVKVGQTVEMSKSHFLVTGAVPKEQPVSDKGPYTIYVRPGTYKADFGGFLLEHHTLFTGPVEFTVKDKADPPAQKEEQMDTAWGKEVGGLQAGLGYKPGGNRVYKHGESVALVVRVRNVGKEEVKFEYLRQYFIETPPAVTDGSGKPVRIGTTLASGEFHKPVDVTLAPGKGIELAEWNLDLLPEDTIGNLGFPTLYGTGKFRLHYARVIGESSAGPKLDPALSKLGTGTLELEVKEPEKKPQKEEKEPFTAWGKEINGLQAGLGYRVAERRAYRHGETVTLVVRLRNVGKETVKFSYLQPYIEHAPTVIDNDGKPVPQPEVIPDIGEYIPGETELSPGKEIELYELKRELRPSKRLAGNDKGRSFFGTGKFVVQYEHALGDPSLGHRSGWKLDPTLSKLATGKLELEVKDTEKKPEGKIKDERKLTADLAKKLLPEAAGISNADFEALAKDPRPESIKSKSLSLAILAFRPQAAIEKNPDAEKEFRFLRETFAVSEVLEAMWISKDKGYASFIQPNFITDCTCNSTAERAEGVVEFKSNLFAGRIPYVAQTTKDGWVITEFRLPQYKFKVVRGKDGLWVQEELKDKQQPPKEQDRSDAFNPVDAGSSLKWLKQRAVAVQIAGENGNELAAKALTNKTRKEILEQKEINWLVPVARVGDYGIRLGGPSEFDGEKGIEYSIRLTTRLPKDVQALSDDELRKFEKLPTPKAEWVLELKKGDKVRVTGKVTEAVLRVDQRFPVGIVWIALDNIKIIPANGEKDPGSGRPAKQDGQSDSSSRKSIAETVREAEVIVVATAVKSEAAPPNVPGDGPEKLVHLKVIQILKGKLDAKTVTVRTRDGEEPHVGKDWVVLLSADNLAKKHFFSPMYTADVEAEIKAILRK